MAVLVGRAQELAELDACVAAASGGTAQFAVLEGVAGIGKTRLLEETLGGIHGSTTVVLQASAEELESARPFGPLTRALASGTAVSPATVQLVAGASSGSLAPSDTSQFGVIDAVLDQLEIMAASTPVVLSIDDLQWADPATIQTLLALLQRLADLPIVVLLALRPLPRSRQLERLMEAVLAHPSRYLQLRALDDHEVAALLAGALDVQPGRSLRAQVRRAGGNPFYLHELVRALDEEGAIEVRDGRAEVIDSAFPATLGSTILRHLRFVEPATIDVLSRAAVLGATFSADDLAALTRRRVDELVDPLRHGIAAGVLLDRADGFAFRHDLVREALYGRLPRGMRARLHLEAARALADSGASAARVATHFAIGAPAGDRRAIALLRQATVEIMMTAPDMAEGFARRAIELSAPGEPEHDQTRADLVTLLVSSGRPTEARVLAGELLGAPHDHTVDGRVQFALGQAAFLVGDLTDAVDKMHLAAGDPSLTAAERSLALAEAAMVQLLAAADLAGAHTDAEAALAAARSASDPIGESMALCVLAGVEQFRGNISQARRLVERATHLGGRTVPIEPGTLNSALRDPHMFRGMVLVDADELDAAADAFRAGSAISAARGVAGRGHFYHYWQGYRHYLAGAWDDALAELQTGLAIADEIENRRGVLAAHALVALIALHRDDLDVAADHLARSEAQFAADGPDFGAEWMLLGRALLHETDGAPAEACALLAGVWSALAELGSRMHYRSLGVDLTRLALATGDTSTGHQTVDALERFAAQEPLVTIRGAALHARGLLDSDGARLLEAADLLRTGPRPLLSARALEDAADALAGDGHGDEGRQRFLDARRIYEELGATRDANRLLARMRAAGLHVGARGPRRRPDHGWDSLTATERRVTELVARGLSNPQIGERLFVSRRTVQTHVSNVFRKLSLTSRAELAGEVVRRQRGMAAEAVVDAPEAREPSEAAPEPTA